MPFMVFITVVQFIQLLMLCAMLVWAVMVFKVFRRNSEQMVRAVKSVIKSIDNIREHVDHGIDVIEQRIVDIRHANDDVKRDIDGLKKSETQREREIQDKGEK